MDYRQVAESLVTDSAGLAYMQSYLYFRGWMILGVLAVGSFVYIKEFYVGLFFSVFLIVGSINFLTDLFTLYPERLASPSPLFTLNVMLRLVVIWFLFVTIKNLGRRPPRADKYNFLLPLRRKVKVDNDSPTAAQPREF